MTTRDLIRHALLEGSKTATEIVGWCNSAQSEGDGGGFIDEPLVSLTLNGLSVAGEVEPHAGIWFATDSMREPRHAIESNGKQHTEPPAINVPEKSVHEEHREVTRTKGWDEFIAEVAKTAPGATRAFSIPAGCSIIEVRRKLVKRKETRDSKWSVISAGEGQCKIRRFTEEESWDVKQKQDVANAARKRALGCADSQDGVLERPGAPRAQERPLLSGEATVDRGRIRADHEATLEPLHECQCAHPDFFAGVRLCKACGGMRQEISVPCLDALEEELRKDLEAIARVRQLMEKQ